jgi:hypothetical protein
MDSNNLRTIDMSLRLLSEQKELMASTMPFVHNAIAHEKLRNLRKQKRHIVSDFKNGKAAPTVLQDLAHVEKSITELAQTVMPEIPAVPYTKCVMNAAKAAAAENTGPMQGAAAIAAMLNVPYNQENDTRDLRILYMTDKISSVNLAKRLIERNCASKSMKEMLSFLGTVAGVSVCEERRLNINATLAEIASLNGTKEALFVPEDWSMPFLSKIAKPKATKKRAADRDA